MLRCYFVLCLSGLPMSKYTKGVPNWAKSRTTSLSRSANNNTTLDLFKVPKPFHTCFPQSLTMPFYSPQMESPHSFQHLQEPRPGQLTPISFSPVGHINFHSDSSCFRKYLPKTDRWYFLSNTSFNVVILI